MKKTVCHKEGNDLMRLMIKTFIPGNTLILLNGLSTLSVRNGLS